MLWLQEHSQDTEHSHEDDGEGLPGDGHVAPRPHGDGGGGEAADEHVDQVIVMPGYVSLHIGSEIIEVLTECFVKFGTQNNPPLR